MKTHSLLLSLILGAVLAGGCGKDEIAELPSLKKSTFSGENLGLTYAGFPMDGKTAVITPDPSDHSKATLEGFSSLSLSSLGLPGELAGPGILPGEQRLNLPIELREECSCGKYSFAGTSESEFLTFGYEGYWTSGGLNLEITNPRLKHPLPEMGAMKPAPLVKSGLTVYSSMPLHLEWELDPGAGIDIPLTPLLQVLATMPLIPVYSGTAYTSVSELICQTIQSVMLTPEGNIPIGYISENGGAAHLAATNPTMLQYTPSASGITLYANPLDVISLAMLSMSEPSDTAYFVTDGHGMHLPYQPGVKTSASGHSTSATTRTPNSGSTPNPLKDAVLEAMIKTIAPAVAEGLPLSLTPDATGVAIYIDTPVASQFAASLLENILSEPQIMEGLKQFAAASGLPGLDAGTVESLLPSLPAILQATTKLQIGVNLIPLANQARE